MSVPLALGWYMWTRHRRGLTLCAAYWLLLAVGARTLPLKSLASEWRLVLYLWPCGGAFGYLVMVLSIGLDARLERRESGFPARLWTLPVPTRFLVGWPMLAGTVGIGLAWLTLPWGAWQSAEFDLTSLIWLPALMLVVMLAWLQVLVWTPVPLPGLRLILLGPLFGVTLIVPMLVFQVVNEALGYALFAVQLPLAYVAASWGVARARRGDVPRWEWPGWPLWLRWTAVKTIGRPFASPQRALVWFEWRRHGVGFPLALAGIALLWCPAVPWIAEAYEVSERGGTPMVLPSLRQEIGSLWLAVAPLLFFPALIASVVGLELGNFSVGDRKRMFSSFVATRPASTAMFLAAKYEMAALSTLAGWTSLLLVAALWFALSGRAAEMTAALDALRQRYPAGPFWTCAALLVAGAVLLTWLQMIQGLWLGLLSERWRLVAVLGFMGGSIAVVPLVSWAAKSSQHWPTVAEILPWLAATSAALKILLAAWSLRALIRYRGLSPAVVGRTLAIWIILAGGLFGVLYGLLPAGSTSISAIVLGIALLVPLTRLALAPLALEWNRHR